MSSQLLLFFLSVLLGGVLCLVYFLLHKLAKKLKLRFLKFVFDVVWCVIAFFSFGALTVFLSDGRFQYFSLLGLIIGVALGALIGNWVKKYKARKKT